MSNGNAGSFTGPVEAIIFDNAGTIVDFGCIAPVMAFVEIFKRRNVDVTVAEAREPMGAAKRDHIVQLVAMPRVAEAWKQAQGAAPTEADVDAMYADFLPLQIQCLTDFSTVIPGTADLFANLRKDGVGIATTTGYPSEVMDVLSAKLSDQGIAPDAMVCASDVAHGRPYPDMCLTAAMKAGVTNVRGCVNVDDSAPGLEAGLAAGMWTVGLACSGNEVGLSYDEWTALSDAERDAHFAQARKGLDATGAHYVVPTIGDLAPVLADINRRLAAGEKP